ncbi:acyl transferase domain-containing protein [Streptomyces sp. 3211.6]|uniref:type I polyketide synthase n=1 Tax=Streptomyces sp. 3211.6 TaxID=1938845 RepID=UPI000EB54099|nr:type I polyketide synthase [Streptomyces sp. 3211.6]RKS97186.1 acyl transferase domain-containing protein [Streptomyces sp. 3211.6]
MSGAAADIAVVGMSCRFPGVNGPGAFWRLLLDGESTVGAFPASRPAGPGRGSHPDAAVLERGSFLDSIDGFDAAFFGTGPAEAAAMDPVQRLGLELAWEAVEDAGIPADTLAGREIDVVVGTAPSGYDLLRRLSGSDRDDHYAALGANGAMIANRISALFDVRGMSYCADSGQSSSLVALALACERIRAGAVDAALAGGVHLIADPEAGAALANLGALSPDGRCFTFDARANGFARGEGGAFVLLKRLDLALADGDHVYAVVRGWGVGSGGASTKMPDPSPAGQAAAVRAALARADVPFDTVDYVEAHGTGTRMGDPAEAAGLREVFRESGRSRPLVIGSVKTNVGHLEPAAGITGFVKAALCLDRAHLVPSLGFRSPNPAIEDFHEHFEVLGAARPWPDVPGRPRRAGVSAFGMGGTNAHVILEQAPEVPASRVPVPRVPAPPRPAADGAPASRVLPWVLSARSEPALREQAARLRDLVAADPSLSPADVGHSLAATRTRFEHRAVVLGAGRSEALEALGLFAAGGDPARVVRGTAGRPAGPVVFVFPGQGSQWQGMGARLYEESEVFAHSVDACAKALAPHVDWSLVDLLTGAEPAALLERIEVVQPALFAMLVSLARVWGSLGVTPDAVIGHSQGEIAAAHVAGALTLEDAARIVALRSRLLSEVAGQGAMAGLLLPEGRVRELLGRWGGRLGIAAVNGPNSTTVSGETEAVRELVAACEAEGVRARLIKSTVPGHSPLLDRFEAELTRGLGRITPLPATAAIHSTVTGGPVDPAELDAAYWFRNLRRTVRFEAATQSLLARGHDTFVEISPHPVLQVAVEETADALGASPVVVGTLNKHDGSTGKVLESLAHLHVRGVPADWEAVFAAGRPRRIALPTYPFRRRPYWLTAPGEEAGADGSGAGAAAAAELGTEAAVLALVCAEAAALLSAARGTDLTGAALAARAAQPFKDLGLESATAVALRNRLAAAAGVRLPATVAFTHPTPRDLARHLFSLLAPEPPATGPESGEEPRQPEEPEGVAAAEKAGPDGLGDDDLYELIDRGYV